MTQLAVNTQIHPATFGGIANGNYIRKFIYTQGLFVLISAPYLLGNAGILSHFFIFATRYGQVGF
jgi:hypothetical protein